MSLQNARLGKPVLAGQEAAIGKPDQSVYALGVGAGGNLQRLERRRGEIHLHQAQ